MVPFTYDKRRGHLGIGIIHQAGDGRLVSAQKIVELRRSVAFKLKTSHILRPLPSSFSAELLSIDIGFAMGTEWQ